MIIYKNDVRLTVSNFFFTYRNALTSNLIKDHESNDKQKKFA